MQRASASARATSHFPRPGTRSFTITAAAVLCFAVWAQHHYVPDGQTVNAPRSELERLQMRAARLGFRLHDVRGDGNCQYRALAHQLWRDERRHSEVRGTAAWWLRESERTPLEPGQSTRLGDFLDREEYPRGWQQLCDAVGRDGVWGDHLSLVAAASAYGRKVNVLSSLPPRAGVPDDGSDAQQSVRTVEPVGARPSGEPLWVAHWHDRHYASLVPAREPGSW
eukprot:TRINITY_DN9197_c0_g1_i1.p1 TRINITY_DN9197_c0_g1~~TRINITY_DN9197_c0_g1_i1.p1  ORF type:complete len:261 (+),score=57.38 TRINITY_DN9197_c0_g1_i1:114-785(+)